MAVKPDDARVVGAGGPTAGQGEARPSPREDARLVAALRAGEPDAFAVLVADYQGAIFNLALRLVRDREDARDITQDVLIKAFGSIPNTTGELHLWAWLYRVTVNTCWDHLRAAGRRPRPAEDVEDLAASHPDGDGERAEAARLFSESLAALPPRQQAALVLKDVHGLDHADIAEALGITRGSSKVLLFHARHSFRRAYTALVTDEPQPAVCRVAEHAAAASVGGRLSAAQRRDRPAPRPHLRGLRQSGGRVARAAQGRPGAGAAHGRGAAPVRRSGGGAGRSGHGPRRSRRRGIRRGRRIRGRRSRRSRSIGGRAATASVAASGAGIRRGGGARAARRRRSAHRARRSASPGESPPSSPDSAWPRWRPS